jgi:hypothetical protein
MLAVVLGTLYCVIQRMSGNLCMVHVVIGRGTSRPRSTLTWRLRQGDTEDKKIDGYITDSRSVEKCIIGYFILILSTYIYSRSIYTVSHFSRSS